MSTVCLSMINLTISYMMSNLYSCIWSWKVCIINLLAKLSNVVYYGVYTFIIAHVLGIWYLQTSCKSIDMFLFFTKNYDIECNIQKHIYRYNELQCHPEPTI